jgi:hypothetical protein
MTTESEKFDATMKKVLSVSKVELQRRIEEEKTQKQITVANSLAKDKTTKPA